MLLFSGGCRFPAVLAFPLGKVTVVLFHNAFHFSESTHKYLNIGITVLFERVGDFIQPVGNLCFGFFDFYFQRFSLFDFEKPLCIGKLLFQLRQNFVLLEVKEKDRTYYEVYSLPRSEEVPEGYKELSFVCLRPDGAFEAPSTVGIMCRTARKKVEGLEDFHFHMLRHTYTSNLLSNGAAPKDVQELLGHADVSTTMNIYAHATREAKRTSARLLDKVIGGE